MEGHIAGVFCLTLLACFLGDWDETRAAEEAQCLFPADQWGTASLQPAGANESIPGFTRDQALAVVDDYREQAKLIGNSHFEKMPLDRHSRYSTLASPVGRVDLLIRQGDIACIVTCTGWLVDSDKFITSRHCLGDTRSTLERIGIRLGFDGPGTLGEFYEATPEPLETSDSVGASSLDYAVVKLEDNAPGVAHGILEPFKGELRSAHSLAIIGHPLAMPKQLVRQDCAAAQLTPREGPLLRHKCHSLYGVSGAPVLDEETGEVLALHKSGGMVSDFSFNYAVLMSDILSRSRVLVALYGKDDSTAPEAEDTQAEGLGELIASINKASEIMAPLTFAVSESIPITADDIDKALDGANANLKKIDEANDFTCPIRYVRQGKLTRLQAYFTREPTSSESEAEYGVAVKSAADFQALVRLPGNVKIIDEINWCGTFGPAIVECSELNGSSVLLETYSTNSNEILARSILHGLGHLAGLTHEADNEKNIMHGIVSPSGRESVTEEQCARLYRHAMLLRARPESSA